MKEYVLKGVEYLSDGISSTVTIRTGSKKQCNETMESLEGSGQYSEMWVDEHIDIDGKIKEMIRLIIAANERWEMHPTKSECKNMTRLKKPQFDHVYLDALYSGFINEQGKSVLVTKQGLEFVAE